MATLPKAYALFETTLQDSISSSATSMTLVSGTDKEGSSLSGTIGFIIDEGSASEEFVIASVTGTACTSMLRGVSVADGVTEVAGLKKAHRKGASIKITNHPLLIRIYRVINGDDAFPDNPQTLGDGSAMATSAAPVADAELANKKYVDDTAVAGAPDATTTVKGNVEIATDGELSAGTGTGGTGASVVACGSSFNETAAAGKVPVADGAGKIGADWGGSASTLATLNGSAKVVEDPANATATPTASKIPIADASGKLDSWTSSQKAMTAGETISGATLPVAVYQNDTDNEFYACDANDTAKMKYLGFAITDGTDGNPITVRYSGIVPGFTGLSEGEKYYVQDDKTIGTSPGTYEVLVGVAISETELLIQKGKRYASGTTTFSSTTSTTITTGFRPSKVTIFANNSSGNVSTSASSQGGWTVAGGNDCAYVGGSTSGGVATTAWRVYESGAGTSHVGDVDTITDTGFNLNNTKAGSPSNASIMWMAEGEL